MKKIISLLSFVFIAGTLIITGCKSDATQTSAKNENIQTNVQETAGVEAITLELPSIQCSMCKKTIEKAFKNVEGVEKINVSMTEKNATVEYDQSRIEKEKIEETIILAGYDVGSKPADKTAYDELHDCCKKFEDRKDKDATYSH